MTKAERNAVNSYKKELIAQGIEKEIAEVMAKSLVETYPYCHCGAKMQEVQDNGNDN